MILVFLDMLRNFGLSTKQTVMTILYVITLACGMMFGAVDYNGDSVVDDEILLFDPNLDENDW